MRRRRAWKRKFLDLDRRIEPLADEGNRFHKGAQYFYDPLDTVKEAPRSAPLEHREKSGQTYDEFIATFKPTVGRHNSRGSKVYNNFGYLNDHGSWVDPDSMGSMNDSMLRSENQEESHQFSNDLPALPITHKGPKIMSDEELNEFYAGYESEVSDDIDGEGDPRQYRITPATFARLAQGAVHGGDMFGGNELDSSVRSFPPNIHNKLTILGLRKPSPLSLLPRPQERSSPHSRARL